jgi:ethanolamine utilization protein EutN
MILGQVVGAIHSTINHRFYDGKKLLIVEKLSPQGKRLGTYLIAVDAIDAGSGETVLVLDEGNSARQVVNDGTAPIRSVIIGIVDEVQL